ncbi:MULTISPECIES: malonyl-ACP O-methyltransferase BioC [Lonsdalea]|uniref:Malonyl-[acyl-carrier protein] O-methyltransferase BioC n=2 Tax=Lonsdalea TaxID=1082702 RepID=A0ACD1J923_9GAMM|nr:MULTISPECIES: malonyl-ACP O-methyltransferase BioC [Lonsdalea]OSM96880.1 malonyl-[acyl-carrier protein] O-methyltransferase BioC [Lonsdalea populi]OSN02370.1 malonyl-[acyl-carrier protein] O-methyltransferase BioC [Lonsdalea populi]QPQ22987.1 malonyl-ACP O-methyltransferase BioC [Lonsdalea populi]RAT11498.1 malonyl-[acyl-carrier protein] O-methyltransferase BioC [Lonsdalea quercina]RAT18616.1 malonyl-[acyl-carrier protein] O-methyltransferase BioC [Lonsdalea quercina]
MTPAESPHKRAIARAFGRAATHYDRFAELQRDSGERLMSLLGDHAGRELLDAGCGTGYFSRRWQAQGKRVTALDLSSQMLAAARQRASATHYVLGDIEHLPLPTASVDLSFSNLAIQWCDDLSRGLGELYRVTRPGGAVAFCTLAQGTLAELENAWRRLDGSRRVNRFLTAPEIEAACRPYRYRLVSAPLTCYFPDVLSLMRSLKGVGATWLHEGRPSRAITRERLRALAEDYPHAPQGYPLTYQRILGVIEHD